MKKGLIFATALAMALGVGAAVGAHQAKVLETKAATTSVKVAGTFTNWATNAVEMTLDGSYYTYLRDFAVNDEFKVVVNNSDWIGANWNGVTNSTSGGIIDGGDPDHNFKVATAGKYLIKAVNNIGDYGEKGYGLTIETYVEPDPDVVYKYKINNGTAVTMTPGDNNQVVSESISFDKGDSLTFLKDDVAYTVAPKDDDQLTKVYSQGNKLVFAEDYEGVLYLNTVTNKLWAGQFTPGYYLAGVNGNWEPKLAVPAVLENGTGPAYKVEGVTLAADSEVKFIQVPNSGATNWFNVDADKLTIGEGITASKVNEGDGYGNLLVETAGEFNLYYNPTNGWYSIEFTPVPVPDPVYKVHCGFETVTFELDETDKPEGVVHQYSANVPYAYRARVLTFYADDVEITANIGAEAGDETHHNNIVGNATDGFKVYHTVDSMKVYLKTYNDGGISLWGEGYAENQFFTKIYNESGYQATVYLNVDDDFTPNETYIKQYKTSSEVSLKALAGTAELNSNTFECGALDQDISIENIAGNNAMQAYQTSKWKVHNDCTETIYVKMKADLSLWMYIGGYEDAHVLTIGGQTIQMEKYGDDQYRALGVALHAGDEVTSYTIEGVSQTVTAKVVGNNNLGADLKVIADATADIYYSVANHTLHVSGLPTGGYHILKNGGTVVQMTATEEFDGFTQYKSEMLSFSVGDTLKFIDTDGAEGVRAAVVFAIGKINEGGKGANFEVVKDEHDVVQHIRCTTACSVAVYMKLKSGLDEVYFGQVEEYIEEATNFANAFKAAMATACSATSNKQGAVEAAWATQATNFAGLSEQAQNELKKGGLSSVAEIREFGERYLSIKQHHSDWDLANFLSWSIPSSGRVASIFDSIVTSNSGIALLVVGIASFSFISLAIYMVVKKRKQK